MSRRRPGERRSHARRGRSDNHDDLAELLVRFEVALSASSSQIFVGMSHVGGFEDLRALEDAGRLDGLLGR
jgi:hypothetical protein